jgi:phosphotransferase system HPr (HPr) family protein
MRESSYTITDPDGIHARPAGLFAREMREYQSSITLIRDDQSADGKKLFSIMKLRVKHGETVVLRAEGTDEDQTVEAAIAWLTRNL